jgi:hypothetical protein
MARQAHTYRCARRRVAKLRYRIKGSEGRVGANMPAYAGSPVPYRFKLKPRTKFVRAAHKPPYNHQAGNLPGSVRRARQRAALALLGCIGGVA